MAAHSAQVHMHLEVVGQSLPIAQLGSDFLILEKPVDLAPTRGAVVMRIDAGERRWPVSLPDGANTAIERTRILRQ